jgi:hypothetical protein
MGSRAGRAWRGIAAAAFAVFAAAVSHSAAAGDPAPILGIVLALTVALPVCVLLAGRRLSWVRLGLAVAVSQFVFHILLQVGVGYVGRVVPGASAMPGMPGMPAAAALHEAMPVMLPALDEHRMTSPAMWVGHAIAAALTIAALGAGERALRALLELVGWSFVARAVQGIAAPQVRRISVFARRTVLSSLSVLSVAPRRGPPVTA